jgi:uncharacterized protein with von Willebrand factor type A (vWA) domain
VIEGGQLATNVVHFARTLRAAGLPVGPGRVKDALGAVVEVGVARRDDFYWALHAALVSRADERAIFDETFRLFWRAPGAPPDSALESTPPGREGERREVSRRVAEALAGSRGERRTARRSRSEVDALLAWSDREALRTKDFEKMSVDEVHEAEAAISALELPVADVPTRRLRPDPRGDRIDPRATLRAALRAGSAAIPLRWRRTARRPPVIVAIIDVSGSMSRYARVSLRFLHALTRGRGHVHSFTLGTRLTNVTRWLRHRDPDLALSEVGRVVRDWDGGTRIGACLREFNLSWSRRLLAGGAIVLLVTDGLDRDAAHGLADEVERLRRSCRRLVWLNPLLRFAGFEPRAAGIRAILPHVDEFRPVHDLESLAQLAEALGRPVTPWSRVTSGPGSRPTPRAP